jgi:hypothetical protein
LMALATFLLYLAFHQPSWPNAANKRNSKSLPFQGLHLWTTTK